MKRRRALKGIFAVGAVTAAGVSGYTVFNLRKSPDVEFIEIQHDLISALSNVIIPETETPGAQSAKVGDFIIKMVKNCLSKKEQNNFIDGLKDVDEMAKSRFAKNFGACSFQEQNIIVAELSESKISQIGILNKVKNKLLGRSFFELLKWLTVLGFCNSELGATNALSYLPVPGYYNACMDIDPQQQRSWATK